MQNLESDAARIQQTLTTFETDVAEARHEFVSSVQQQLADASGDGASRHEEGLGVPSPVHSYTVMITTTLFGSDEDNSAASPLVHSTRSGDYIGCYQDNEGPEFERQEKLKKLCAANDDVVQACATKRDLRQGLHNEPPIPKLVSGARFRPSTPSSTPSPQTPS